MEILVQKIEILVKYLKNRNFGQKKNRKKNPKN